MAGWGWGHRRIRGCSPRSVMDSGNLLPLQASVYPVTQEGGISSFGIKSLGQEEVGSGVFTV